MRSLLQKIHLAIMLVTVATFASSCSMYLEPPGDHRSEHRDGSVIWFQVMKERMDRQWYLVLAAYGEKGTHTRVTIEECKIYDGRNHELLSMKPFELNLTRSVGGMPNQVGTGMTYSEDFRIAHRSSNPVTVKFKAVVYSKNGQKTFHRGEFQFGPDLIGFD